MSVRSDPILPGRPPTTLHERPWLNFYDYWVPPHLRYPRQPVQHILDIAAARYGSNTATIFFGAKLTYRDIQRQARRFAAALYTLGVRKGDRVGIMLPNCPQYLVAFYGSLMAGGIVVNVNPTYTEREIEFITADSGLKTIIVLDMLAPRVLSAVGKVLRTALRQS